MSCIDSSGMRCNKSRQSPGYTTMCRESENWSHILYLPNIKVHYSYFDCASTVCRGEMKAPGTFFRGDISDNHHSVAASALLGGSAYWGRAKHLRFKIYDFFSSRLSVVNSNTVLIRVHSWLRIKIG